MRFIYNWIVIVSLSLGMYTCDDSPSGETPAKGLTGTITDLSGIALEGVTVSLAIKNISTTTDAKGMFELSTGQVMGWQEMDEVIDTLKISDTEYLSKKRYVRSLTENISLVVWDKAFHIDAFGAWRDFPEYFVTFDTEQLYELIDGGDEKYINQGLIDGINQYFSKSTGQTCDAMVFNFRTKEKAQAMYATQIEEVITKIVLPEFDESVALGEVIGGGANFYAHFGQFEVELILQGYGDSQQEILKKDGVTFLKAYEKVISGK